MVKNEDFIHIALKVCTFRKIRKRLKSTIMGLHNFLVIDVLTSIPIFVTCYLLAAPINNTSNILIKYVYIKMTWIVFSVKNMTI